MENHTFYITELYRVLDGYGNYPKLAERLKLLLDLNKKDLIAGLEQLIMDCTTKDVPNDSPSLQLLKHVYRKITS